MEYVHNLVSWLSGLTARELVLELAEFPGIRDDADYNPLALYLSDNTGELVSVTETYISGEWDGEIIWLPDSLATILSHFDNGDLPILER